MANNNSLQPAAPQGGALAKQTKPVNILKAMLNEESVQEQFRNALGRHKDAFVASLIDVYTSDQALQTCAPKLVVAQALKAATLQLPLNKALGFAYIVVYNNSVRNPDGSWSKVPTPTFIPGYRGLIQLAKRSQMYETINADVVYEGELVKADKLSGGLDLGGEKKSDKIIGYFAYIKEINGFQKVLYMTVEQMVKYAMKFSPSIPKGMTVEKLTEIAQQDNVSKGVGWVANFTAMAKKTVLRRLISVYGSQSVEMQTAMIGESEADSNAMGSRNEMIADRANTQAIDIDAVTYEEVDTDTGEVMQEAPQQAAAPAPKGERKPGGTLFAGGEEDPGY